MEILKPDGTGGSWGLTDDLARTVIKNIIPGTVIDFGAGMGKYGFLLRDIFGRGIKVDAVECFEDSVAWLNTLGMYRNVYHANIIDWEFRDNYDLAIFGDVLEHLPYKQVLNLLDNLKRKKIFKYIMLVVPLNDVEQGSCGGNEAERHLCVINEERFEKHVREYDYRITHKYVVDADGPKGSYKKMLMILKV